jgi:NAD(P)H dehydrogenase (quinone)
MANKTIVVTGATGTVGSRIVNNLVARRREQVVAFVRDPRRAEQLVSVGAKLRLGTFEDLVSLREAFVGADTVVLVTAGPTLAEQSLAAIRAARESGVRKIVRISSGKASTQRLTESTRHHACADAALRESGLSFVILCPNSFMQNLLFSVGSLRHDGKLYSGLGTGKLGFIDVRDIADAAAAATVSDAWNGQTLELTGPAAIDYDTVAATISKELARPVTYVPVSPEAAGEAARSHGADDWTVKAITEFAVASSGGWGNYTTDNVAKLTGHPSRSLEDFVREVLVPAMRAS